MKNKYKWAVVTVLCVIMIISVIITNPYSENELPITPDTENVFNDQSEMENILPSTVFPKLALLSPFSPSGFLQHVGGSGKDSIKNLWQSEDYTYAVGETSSIDYDFYSSKGKVFIAKIDNIGRLLSISVPEESVLLLDSQITQYGLVLFTQNQNSSVLSIYNDELHVTRSISLPICIQGDILVSGDFLYLLTKTEFSFSIKKYDFDLVQKTDSGYSFPSEVFISDFSIIGNTVSVLIECESACYICRFNADLSLEFQKKLQLLENITVLSSLPTLFSGALGYSILYKNESGEIYFSGITVDGDIQWSNLIAKGTDGRFARTISGRYIVFIKNESTSFACMLCPHGDVIEKDILSLSGSFPLEYTYSVNGLTLLTESVNEKKGAIVFIDENDSPSTVFSFPSCRPKTLCLSQNGRITVGVDVSDYSSPFGSGKGELSCFVIGLND